MKEKQPNENNTKYLNDLVEIKVPRMSLCWIKSHLVDYCADNAFTLDGKIQALRLVVAIDDAEKDELQKEQG